MSKQSQDSNISYINKCAVEPNNVIVEIKNITEKGSELCSLSLNGELIFNSGYLIDPAGVKKSLLENRQVISLTILADDKSNARIEGEFFVQGWRELNARIQASFMSSGPISATDQSSLTDYLAPKLRINSFNRLEVKHSRPAQS